MGPGGVPAVQDAHAPGRLTRAQGPRGLYGHKLVWPRPAPGPSEQPRPAPGPSEQPPPCPGAQPVPVGEAQPEHVVHKQPQRLHRPQQHHVADVELDPPHVLSKEQDGTLNVLGHDLEGGEAGSRGSPHLGQGRAPHAACLGPHTPGSRRAPGASCLAPWRDPPPVLSRFLSFSNPRLAWDTLLTVPSPGMEGKETTRFQA